MIENKTAGTKKQEPERAKGTILIVDDEPSICLILKEFLSLNGFVAHTASLAEEAIEILNAIEVDLVITNIRMPGMDGLELTRLIKRRYASDVIIMTGYHSYTIEDARLIGADDLLHKPAELVDLLDSVNRILDRPNFDYSR